MPSTPLSRCSKYANGPLFIPSRRGNKILLFNGYTYNQGPIFIPSRRGNKILLFNGYTYNQSHLKCPRYYCTKKYKLSCKAKVKLDKNGSAIVEVLETHNHEPPVLDMTEFGKYIPIVK
ncbi:uncharacterized protein [Choristoneura fumiferana]|uniref:uncharacterized protein n=1 Tax=Choristoneura fumiferana TaxID=7141 RepID=UPI003D154755